MIILKLQGGLGNQMFEYAFGRSIQEQVNQKMVLDISDFQYDKKRKYALNHFILGEDIFIDDSGQYNYKYDQRVNKFLSIGGKWFPNLQYKYLSQKGIHIWDHAIYKEVVVDRTQKDLFFHGYWQGYQYSEHITDILQKEFSVKEAILPINLKLYNQMKETNSVCIHIRRGDFLLKSNIMYVCKSSYYEAALAEIEKRDSELTYFVFSDDINEVKAKFNFGERKIVFIDWENPDYEELRLMYSCKHFVISNSTFSWWAANLSQRPGKVVVAPERWYTDKRDVSQLIKEGWITVNN